MSEKIESGDAAVAEKLAWKTPNIESFAVAGITQSNPGGNSQDGVNFSTIS